MKYFARIVMHFPLEAFDKSFHESLKDFERGFRELVKASGRSEKEKSRLQRHVAHLADRFSTTLLLQLPFYQGLAGNMLESVFLPDISPETFYIRLVVSNDAGSLGLRHLAEECLKHAVDQGGYGYADEGTMTGSCYLTNGVATGFTYQSDYPGKGWFIGDNNALASGAEYN